MFLLLSAGCGDNEAAPVAAQWSEGDIDPFGCPYVRPVPWVDEESHRTVCGSECRPTREDGMFIACIGEDVPTLDPDILVAPGEACVTHPIDDRDYFFDSIHEAWPYWHLCWTFCGSDEPLMPFGDPELPGSFDPPDECTVEQ